MIDWNRVRDLRDEIGEEGFEEVANLFLEETDEVAARLTQTPDIGRLARDLHFLKGSALNLGFRALAGLCQDGERRAGDGAAVDVGAILQTYHASKAAFRVGPAEAAA